MSSYFKILPNLLYPNIGQGTQTYKLVSNIFAKTAFISNILEDSTLYYPYDVMEGEKPEDVAYKFYGDPKKYWIILMSNNCIDPQYDWPMGSGVFANFINSKYSSLNLTLDPSETFGASDYSTGEVVYQGSDIVGSSAKANVVDYDYTNKSLQINFPSEVFSVDSSVTGLNSEVSHNIISINSNNDGFNWASNTNIHFVQNISKQNSYDQKITKSENIISQTSYDNSRIHSSGADKLYTIVDYTSKNESFVLSDGTTFSMQTNYYPVSYYDYEQNNNEAKRHIKIIQPQYASVIESELVKLMSK